MRAKYTKTVIFMVLAAFLVLSLGGMAAVSEHGGVMAVTVLLLAAVAAGVWFSFQFGIFVGKTRVFVYDGTACKLFFKDEIKYVRVEIFDSLITAAVRIHSREYGWQNHTFVWEPVRTLSRSHDIIPFRQYLVIDDAFVKKTTDRLGAHPFAAVTDKREK